MRSLIKKSFPLLLVLVVLLAASLGCEFLNGNDNQENEPSNEPSRGTPPSPPESKEPAGVTYSDPQPSFITSIHMFTETAGWAFGTPQNDVVQVYVTGDGGFSWKNVTPPEGPPSESGKVKQVVSFFMDKNTAWVTFFVPREFPDNPIVWITQNWGLTWQASSPLPVGGGDFYSPTQMTFANPNHGWLRIAVGAGMSKSYLTILRPTNGGATWDRIVDPYTEDDLHACPKSGMDFFNPNNGWITRECKGLYSSTFIDVTADGGMTWESIDLPLPPDNPDALNQGYCDVYSPTLFSPNKGALSVMCKSYQTDPATEQWYFYTTSDSGNTWNILPFAGGEMQFIDNQIGWSSNDELSKTMDGGQTWTGIGFLVWDIQFSFINATHGWAVEQPYGDYALKFTTDGALTWDYILPEVNP